MKRQFLFSTYETPLGKILRVLEKKYLKRSISVSCKQTILQIGALGWENEFIDCSLYERFNVLDAKGKGCDDAIKITARSYLLPIQSETVDMVILPHLLEFDENRFQTMREIERVLKPEGELIILSFNPINASVNMQFLWNKKMSDSWKGYFIFRKRLVEWLKVLNFEIKSTSEFTTDSILTTNDGFKLGKRTFFSMAYAVRAVKRQYTYIPLTPVKRKNAELISATSGLKTSTHRKKKHD